MLKIAFDKDYVHPLEKNHRFPMVKYELIPEQLLREGSCSNDNFFVPGIASDDEIVMTHEPKYYDKLCSLSLSKKEERPIGFPMSAELVLREKKIVKGTIECCNFSIENGVAMNIAGGTHHAFYDRGEAFCILNDQSVAANVLLNEKKEINKILIVDLDVHQGNGTASLFNDKEDVFTLSFHGKNNYPFRKEKSNFDLDFEDNTDDCFYLNKLKKYLPKIIDNFEPDFIFYLSGVDILKNDKLGKLGLSIEGCKKRDRFVLETCKKNKIPLQVSMGGGYSSNLRDIIEAHSNTFRLAQDIFF
ncbi:MAG: histone deacetylase [Flammeovirgaceae bacterium TMED290]|nr:MAG: histone deacetylase [Flammeovirgaceae bacterium TMED290]|tara:strand:+ start:109 stop:1014 length:906 start_codon:yes stop_codon:yes gene_type:complete